MDLSDISSSKKAFALAKHYLVGGVNSPARAFAFVKGEPPFISKAKGAYIYDLQSRKYIDYVNSWGACIVGHGHPQVVDAIAAQAALGISYGAPTLLEVELAQKIVKHIPSMEKMRFVCSGTEATMSAIRLARAYTKRHKILKFSGHYHGHSDALLVASGSGVVTQGMAGSLGVPESFVAPTLVAPYNCLDSLEEVFRDHGHTIACVIFEVVVGNSGFLLPKAGYLQKLASLAKEHGVLLVADEVMTGFRVGMGGAAKIYGIQPDITVLGKVIGGGLPVGAYGGKKEIMSLVAPEGGVYQAGTLAGSPIAMVSGLKTLEILENSDFAVLCRRTAELCKGLKESADEYNVPLVAESLGAMFGYAFSPKPVHNLEDVQSLDHRLFVQFFYSMLGSGIYLPPSPYEACFLSLDHSHEDVALTLESARKAMAHVRRVMDGDGA